MQRNTKLLAALAALCLGTAGAATGYITVEHERIINSTVDATPIGTTTPSGANFTALFTGMGTATSSFTVGTGYSEFQIGSGTTAPVRRGLTWGPDPAGDVTAWVNGAENNPLFQVKDGGSNATYFTAGPNGITAPGITSSGNATISGSLNVSSGATVTGTIYTNTVGATGNGVFGGTLTASSFLGNASTATALASTPISCPYVSNIAGNYYEPSLGINALGNSICGPLHQSAILTNGCTTASGTNSSCTNTVPWPTPFADTNYTVVCQGGGPSDPARTALTMQQRQTTGIVVNTENTGNEAVSFATIHCIAEHF